MNNNPTDRPIAAFDPVTGEPTTHLVVCECPCGATALATPERADTARCAQCHRNAAITGTSGDQP